MKSSSLPAGLPIVVFLFLFLAATAAAALPPSGSLDTSFGGSGRVSLPIAPGQATDEALAVAIQKDGRILVAGYTTPSPQKFAVARLLPDGSLDTTFNGTGVLTLSLRNVQDRAQAIAIQGDGKILVGGYSRLSGSDDFALVRLLQDGTLDPSFGVGGTAISVVGPADDRIQALALQPDGKIVAAGYVKIGNLDVAVVRYDIDGKEDPGFGIQGRRVLSVGTGSDVANAVAVDGTGRVVVAGYASDATQHDMLIARLTANGAPDGTFNGTGTLRIEFDGGDEYAQGLAILPDGAILAAGYARVGSQNRFAIARALPGGELDTSFGVDGLVSTEIGSNAEGRALALHPRGRFVVAGKARVNGKWNFALAQYRSDGNLDPTFGDHGIAVVQVGTQTDEAYALAIQGDGALVAAGTTRSNSNANFGVVRLFVNDCGDGFLDDDEQCDDPGIGNGGCCSTECSLLPADTTCRPEAGACDRAEVCDGVAAACPDDEWLPANTTCRSAAGECDLEEICDGLGPVCPVDLRVPGGTVCRPGIDACDTAETCDGTSVACPADVLSSAGTVCRAPAGGCDAAEVCDGSRASCPEDEILPAGTTCRPANGGCDVAEICDGAGTACPVDSFAPAGANCRPSQDACDVADSCSGTAGACPDQRLPDGDADGICDAIDVCPQMSDPQQKDADADGIGDACDACTNGRRLTKAVLRMGGFTTPGGDDTFTMRGNVKFGSVTPPLFPEVTGARFLVEDATGAVLFDAKIPAGAFNFVKQVGWKVNPKRTVMIFKSADPVGGLVNQVKLVARKARPGIVQASVTGRDGGFARTPIALPLHVTLVVDSTAAHLGRCGEATFRNTGALCTFKDEGATLVCHD